MYSFVALGLPDGMIGTAWPALRRSFGVPLEYLGIVLLVGTAGSVLSSSVSGLVLARLGVGATVMLAGTAGALGAVGIIVSPAFWVFVVAGTAIGVAAGFLDSAVNTSVALSGRNRLLNLLHGCYGVGTTVGPLVVTAAVLAGSWRPAYVVLLGVEAVVVAGWWLVGRRLLARQVQAAYTDALLAPGARPPQRGQPELGQPELGQPELGQPELGQLGPASGLSHQSNNANEPNCAPAAVGTSVAAGPDAGSASVGHWRLFGVVALGLVVFMLYTGLEASAGQWEPSFDRGPLHLGAGAAGVATFGYWGALTLVRFALAVPRRPVAPTTIVRSGCALAIAGAAVVWWRPSAVACLLGLVVIGGALAGVFPALVSLTPIRVGEDMAKHVIGWQIGAAGIGGAAISACFGAIFQRYGLVNFGPALLAVSLLLMAGSILLERASVRPTR
jgi:fucose permease